MSSGRALDRLYAGQPGDRERVTLGDGPVAQGRDRRRGQQHPAPGAGLAGGDRLGGHVDHVRRAVGADVRQPARPPGPAVALIDCHCV